LNNPLTSKPESSASPAQALRVVVMGVAGSGKSSVGVALAARMAATYIDGDDLHSAANREKMSAGIPLTDNDRTPWLVRVAEALRAAAGPTLIGCSALKRQYRDLIRRVVGDTVIFLHLAGARDVIAAHMAERRGHFMPLGLLDSQFAALEPLQPDEVGFAVDIAQPFDGVVAEAARILGGQFA
jgi:carbohydrate kinase (thermoresistant glucokinase family)